MGIRTFKPTSASRRFITSSDFAEITKDSPEKSLTTSLRKTGARNNFGQITTRHQGGGHKRRYRIIDFRRLKREIPATDLSGQAGTRCDRQSVSGCA